MKIQTKMKLNILLVFLLATLGTFAQSKKEKLKRSFPASADVSIHVDTRYTNLVFETWNRDEVQVEAVIEGKSSDKERIEKAMGNWDIKVNGGRDLIRIVSEDGAGDFTMGMHDINVEGLGELIEGSLTMVEPVLEGLLGPLMEGLTGTRLPAEYYDGMNKIKFDYKRYKKEGEKYLEEYERKMEEFYGDDFEDAMEKWGEENEEKMKDWEESLGKGLGFPKSPFGSIKNMNIDGDDYEKDPQGYLDRMNKKYGTNVTRKEMDRWLADVEAWGERFGTRMEAWGEEFGERFGKSMEKWGEEFGKNVEKNMEEWGENFGKSMEKWGEQFGERMEKWAEEHEADWERTVEEDEDGNKSTSFHFNYDTDDDPKWNGADRFERTVIVRMPKNAQLNLDVRYGDVNISSAYNPYIDLTHGQLAIRQVSGKSTDISVAHSPLNIGSFNGGKLDVRNVRKCFINDASNITLDSNSSDVTINKLNGSGMISGNFGELVIPEVGDGFESLSIILDNSEMVLQLPKNAFNFNYSGVQSTLRTPKALETKEMTNGDNKMVNGYRKSRNTDKSISITAQFSEVILRD